MSSEIAEEEEGDPGFLMFNTPSGQDVAVYECDILTIWSSTTEGHTILELSTGNIEVVYPFNELIENIFHHTDLRGGCGTDRIRAQTSPKENGVVKLRSVNGGDDGI